jgi:hypothetical protein
MRRTFAFSALGISERGLASAAKWERSRSLQYVLSIVHRETDGMGGTNSVSTLGILASALPMTRAPAKLR